MNVYSEFKNKARLELLYWLQNYNVLEMRKYWLNELGGIAEVW